MTPERVARLLKDGVLQAYAKREPLQYSDDGGAWRDYTYGAKPDLQFTVGFEWRKRPEQREWWVLEDGSNCPFRHASFEEAKAAVKRNEAYYQNYPIIHVKEVL